MTRNYSTIAVLVAFALFVVGVLAALLLHFPKAGFYGLLLFVSTLTIAVAFELTNDTALRPPRSLLTWLPVLAYSTGLILILASAVARFFFAAPSIHRLTAVGLALFLTGLALQILISGVRGIRVNVQQGRKWVAVLKGLTALILCGALCYYVFKFIPLGR
jgi:hypothetical protein